MTGPVRAALGIWRARTSRTSRDGAYAVYLALMVALVTVIPGVRAAWLGLTSPEGIAAITAAGAPDAAIAVVAALWAGALLLGRDRGPAVRPPFLTHALATSGLAGAESFRGPVLRAGALVTVLTTATAGLLGAALVGARLAGPLDAAVFLAVGAVVGAVTTVAWLAGQALPRAAVAIAVGVCGLGAATAAAPALRPFTPMGWVGLAYPVAGDPPAVAALTALAALSAALVCAIPTLLNRLRLRELLAQSARWDSATVHAGGMDFSAAVAVYQRRPRLGRRLRAVRGLGRPALVFLVRDAIGAARTPGRLLLGVLAVAGAGAVLALAFTPAAAGWALGAAAGTTLFAGLGPLSDGLRHAASVAAGLPLYGIGDGPLLARHLLFPTVVALLALLTAVLVTSSAAGIPALGPLVGALALGPLALLARVNAALKGPMPPALLAPVPTPVGDLGAAVRMAWAVDGLLLVALSGAAAALVLESPLLLLGAALALLGIGASRWRQRG
ncbi:hypothetical protein [Agromyces soli]|uniref:ABC-2 type transport system permease protein n=1 Tax=Agromyces soli TaxID=659012 RepID=A0ABY4AXD2_9MICO|nr:hypothetical protein [Agromyces soli]UOE27857.1 hypothetical protein MTP13_08810 [Agromyces soli]